jgi:hypothetical protein
VRESDESEAHTVLAAAEEPARPALDSAAVPRALPLITKRIAPVAAMLATKHVDAAGVV